MPEELRAAAVYRELLQVALAELTRRDQRIAALEAQVSALRAETRRYLAAQVSVAD